MPYASTRYAAALIQRHPRLDLAEHQFAVEAVVRSAADGYTLLAIGVANAIKATLHDQLNFIRDTKQL